MTSIFRGLTPSGYGIVTPSGFCVSPAVSQPVGALLEAWHPLAQQGDEDSQLPIPLHCVQKNATQTVCPPD